MPGGDSKRGSTARSSGGYRGRTMLLPRTNEWAVRMARAPGRFAAAGWRGIVAAPRAVARTPRAAYQATKARLTGRDQITPHTIGARKRELKRVYSMAIMGMALLIMVAFLNNRKGYITAVVITLVLGVAFVVWMGHRRALMTAAALGGWLISTPLIALAGAFGLEPQYIQERMATSYEAIIGTGIAVWVCALLVRSRRPWLTIIACWLIYVFTLILGGQFFPRYSLLGGWSALALFLAWRAGWFTVLVDRVRGRRGLGRHYDSATEEQYEAYEEIASLPRGFVRMYQVAVQPEYKPATGLDALVCGGTGLFYVHAMGVSGRLTVSAAGTRRRIKVDGVPLDTELVDVARNAQALGDALRAGVSTLVAVSGATFPEHTYGILPITVTPPARREAISMTLIDAALLSRRIPFGRPVYTAHQMQRIVHRANRRLLELTVGEVDTPKKRRRKKLSSRKSPFTPGAAVEWSDESGEWLGWICTTGATVLTETPKQTLATKVSAGDTVVWVVSEAEWQRSRQAGREPDPDLTQPVPIGSLVVAGSLHGPHESQDRERDATHRPDGGGKR